MEKVNGMEYNAWLVRVNLDNVESNYNELMQSVGFMLCDSNYAIKEQLKNNYVYYDGIDWEKVNMEDIREWLNVINEERIES